MGPAGAGGVDRAPDQVVRLQEFLILNPEWSVGFDGDTRQWRAWHDDGDDVHADYLRDLLDQLEKL